MAQNQTLSLLIETRVSGTQEIERLNTAHGRLYQSIDQSSKALEEGARRTAAVVEHTKRAAEAVFGLVGAYGAATLATTSHSLAAERLVDVYRGVRLALSPSMFTVYTLAAGAAVEMTIRLTDAQARLNEQIAIRAGRAGIGFDQQYSLSLIQQRQNFDFTSSFKASGGSLLQLGQQLKDLGEIKDPIERVQESIRIFGKEVGEQILPQLNERFLTNQQRIEEWGIGIDKVGRENLQEFKDDFHNFFLGFSEDADAIVLLAKKVGIGLSEITADSYVWLKNAYSRYQQNLGNSGEFNSGIPGLTLEPFDVRAAIMGTRTMAGMPSALNGPASLAMRSLAGISIRDILGGGDEFRKRQKEDAEARIKANEEFFLHPQDTKEWMGQKDLRATQLLADRARVQSINQEIQAEKDAAEAAKRAAEEIKALGESMRNIGQRAAVAEASRSYDQFTGIQLKTPQAEAEVEQTIANLRERFGILFTPARERKARADLSLEVQSARTEDALNISRATGEQQLSLSNYFQSYAGQLENQFRGIGGAGPQGLLDAVVRANQEQITHEIETNSEVRKIGLNAQREAMIRTAGRQQSLVEITAEPGYAGAVNAANKAYDVRIALAKELRDLDLDTAYKEEDAGRRRIDIARAEADLTRQTAEAAIDRELKLAEIQKRRVDEFRSLAADFVGAAEQHSLPSFFKAQGQRIQGQIVGNAAEMAFKFLPNLSVTNDPNSVLGKLLAGTPFGAKPSDPATKAAQDTAQYTKDTRDILAAMAGLPNTSVTIPGFGGSGGLNIPGLSTFGSDTNGITGTLLKSFGPLGSSILPFLRTGGGGAPSVTADELSNLGIFGPAMAGTTASKPSIWGNLGGASGLGSQVSSALGLAGAGLGAFQGISQAAKGGARNIIGGIGETAMAIAPFTGPAAPFVMAGALGMELISSLFGDPKANRQRDINRRLAADQFYTPVAIDAVMGTNGSAISTDRYGQVQSLDISPYPQVQQPYADLRNGITVPGRTASPIGGPSGINPGPAMNVTIQAFDSQSFNQFAQNNKAAFADAVSSAVLHGHGESLVENIAGRVR